MEKIIYKAGIAAYTFAIKLMAPFNKKAAKWVEGREGIFEQMALKLSENKSPIAWFHCASLGEFEQARPVLEEFKAFYPDYKILLTFFSPSGYEVRKSYAHADYVFYLPPDGASNANKFIKITQPALVFFVKYEFWHFYLSELHKNNIPIVSFSAIFRKDQIFFKPYGSFYKAILAKFEHIFVQNEESVKLLHQLGITKVSKAGDTRFDRVVNIVQSKKPVSKAEAFKNNQKLLAVGSSWAQDMDVLIPFINSFNMPLKILIAPHEINPEEIGSFIKKIHKRSVLYSTASEQQLKEADVLFIDNIGMLSALYQYAEFAWIGGAFGKGLHNILEAATYGMPLFYGPKYAKFQEAKDLVSIGSAFSVRNTEEFEAVFTNLYTDDAKRKALAAQSASYVERNTGATETILNWVKQNFVPSKRRSEI